VQQEPRTNAAPNSRSWLTRVARLAVTAFVLWLVFSRVPLADVAGRLRTASPGWVLAAVVTLLPLLATAARRFRILTDQQGLSLSTWQIAEVNLVTSFYALILPGALAGGAIRWYRLRQIEGRGSEILAAMLLSRLIYLIAVVVLGILLWIVARPDATQTSGVVGLLVLLGCLLGLCVLFFGRWTHTAVSKRLSPRSDGKGTRAWRQRFDRLLLALGQLRDLSGRGLVGLALLSLAENLLGIVLLYFLSRSLGIDVSMAAIGWIRSIVRIVTLVPISLSGLGIREGTLVLLLAPYGVPGADAVALSLLSFGLSILTGAAGAVCELRRATARSGTGSQHPSRG
jgi:uncharacterized protein (TIRG00374 family)